jgi:hypothetical protein
VSGSRRLEEDLESYSNDVLRCSVNTRVNPHATRLNAIFSSDIGHWDVPDMTEVTAEAYELVEHGLITEDDFRDFVFANPARLWTSMNSDFFEGTAVEHEVKQLLAATE